VKPGDRVRALSGECVGYIGIVDSVTVDGAAVRFPGQNGSPFPRSVVLPISQLERLPGQRRVRFVPDQDLDEAPF
jgi:hypothetical protein